MSVKICVVKRRVKISAVCSISATISHSKYITSYIFDLVKMYNIDYCHGLCVRTGSQVSSSMIINIAWHLKSTWNPDKDTKVDFL